MRRRLSTWSVTVLVALMSLVLTSAATPAQAVSSAFTRTQSLTRANNVYAMPLDTFTNLRIKYQRVLPVYVDATLEWSADGCSVPPKHQYDFAAVKEYMRIFSFACARHDFGYRNFGNGYYTPYKNRALDPSNDRKNIVDHRFLADMNAECRTVSAAARPFCYKMAALFFAGVRTSSGDTAWSAGGECLPNKLCLFANPNLRGKRWMFSVSQPGLGRYHFANEADAVKNTSKVAWVASQRTNYGGSKLCIRPGMTMTSLSPGWSDQIDSVRRLTTTRC